MNVVHRRQCLGALTYPPTAYLPIERSPSVPQTRSNDALSRAIVSYGLRLKGDRYSQPFEAPKYKRIDEIEDLSGSILLSPSMPLCLSERRTYLLT